jgi:hypothetical protein
VALVVLALIARTPGRLAPVPPPASLAGILAEQHPATGPKHPNPVSAP